MSWFSKISSRNIRFTEEIAQGIKEIANTVLDYYLANNKNPQYAGILKFTDPYQNTQKNIKVVILPTSRTSEQIAHYDLKDMISIFPYNLQTENTNKQLLLNAFEDGINHEITHTIDPKSKLSIQKPSNKNEYYSSPIEFDGYSKQIIEQLKREIENNNSIQSIIDEWLRTDILQDGNPILNYIEALTAWDQSDQENNTNYIRKLKLRIYNEILAKENEDV